MPGQQNDGKGQDLRIAAANLAVRYDARYEVAIPIEVSGIDPNGKAFHALRRTRNVSEWGCAFRLPVELKADDIVSLRVISPDTGEFAPGQHSLFQVLRVTQEEDGWLVGAWKMASGDVWGGELKKIAAHDAAPDASKEESAGHTKSLPKDADR